MSKDDAIRALHESLAADSSTPTLRRSDDRDAYLRDKRAELLACVIEPVTVVARAGEWAQKHCGLSAEPYLMVAVAYAHSKVGSCLLYNPENGLFSLAYGHPEAAEGLDLVGYSSADALAEWLG